MSEKTLGQLLYEAAPWQTNGYWRELFDWAQDLYEKGALKFIAEYERRQWRPIAEAPRDGTWVLLWWGDRVVEGHWLDNSHTQFPWAGWKLRSMVVHNPSYKPTHWRPLPPPPEHDSKGPSHA